jgi:flagellar hook assembly protein FlgD
MQFDIGSYISLTDRVMLRFIASDYGQENTVEALVDDIEITGCSSAAGLDDEHLETTSDEVTLLGIERNPFTQATHVFFAVTRRVRAKVRIYDARGRLIRNLLDAEVEQGYHSLVWAGRTTSGHPASAGVYFVRLEAEGKIKTAKAILNR